MSSVVVLGITALMAGFSAKLADVQNNEASSWLPGSAESTKVLDELSETVDPNDIPTLVVYHRDTAELIPYYRSRGLLSEVEGRGGIEQVYNNLTKVLKT